MLSLQSSASELTKFWAATFCPNPDFLSYERGNCHNSLLCIYLFTSFFFNFHDLKKKFIRKLPTEPKETANQHEKIEKGVNFTSLSMNEKIFVIYHNSLYLINICEKRKTPKNYGNAFSENILPHCDTYVADG